MWLVCLYNVILVGALQGGVVADFPNFGTVYPASDRKNACALRMQRPHLSQHTKTARTAVPIMQTLSPSVCQISRPKPGIKRDSVALKSSTAAPAPSIDADASTGLSSGLQPWAHEGCLGESRRQSLTRSWGTTTSWKPPGCMSCTAR